MAYNIKFYNEQDPETSLQWFVMDDHLYLTLGGHTVESIKLDADTVWHIIDQLQKDLPLISNGWEYPKNDE